MARIIGRTVGRGNAQLDITGFKRHSCETLIFGDAGLRVPSDRENLLAADHTTKFLAHSPCAMEHQVGKFRTHNVQNHSLPVRAPRRVGRYSRVFWPRRSEFMAFKLHFIFSRWSVFCSRKS